MTLNDIKLKRLTEAREKKEGKRKRKLVTDPKGRQTYIMVDEDEEILDEGTKKHHTPKFVQHCVSAITEDPKKLAKVKAGGEDGEGSPFAICHASYKKKTRSKAADHAQQAKGEKKHHTVKDYEKALEKLREAVEERTAMNPDPRSVTFGTVLESAPAPRTVRFAPRG
jgi:hypothetical protein